ncbi:hypothetical protein ACBY01_15660 [Sphingomonas sp. ac-8]|uniref:hypothetical protein n=1 Tax=Sphingomonas sp. ac-8 TaxID=3242977 RepID=UPI003A80A1FF
MFSYEAIKWRSERRSFVRLILLAAPCTLAFAAPTVAQVTVDVPIWGNGILGQQAMRSTFDHHDETHDIGSEVERAKTRPGNCSADALPVADRRRMENEYVRRAHADGKASANAWVREQGMRFRRQLVAQGVCPDPATRTAARR